MTGCERVLALLSDGEPHSHHSLYGLRVIAHSRVADLRKRGHVIDCWVEEGTHYYQLRLLDQRDEDCGAGDPPPQAVPLIEQVDGQLAFGAPQHSYELDAA